MEGYSRKGIIRGSGLTSSEVRFYTEQELVTPEIDTGKGRGKVRLYSRKNLRQFRLIKVLTGFGIKIEVMRVILNELPISAPLEKTHLDGLYLLTIKSHPERGLTVGMKIRERPEGRATDIRGNFYKTHVVHSVDDFKEFPAILTIDLVALFKDL